MKSVIIKPRNEILRKYVQYFLFFGKTDSTLLNYVTFPNNNLCLAIYKENNINYINQPQKNNCIITKGNKIFTSRFYGFHKMPLTVDINAHLDQICVIFKPSALRAFTGESYHNLMNSDEVFKIFDTKDEFILEQIFDELDLAKRAAKLEYLLLSNLNYEVSYQLKEALFIISNNNDDNFKVEKLATKLKISKPSLFRLFKNHLGQNPKSYIKTIRFRNVLEDVLNRQNTLTNIAHTNQYFDQAHFINDFKMFTGYSPTQLSDKISVQQNHLAWIYNKK